MLLSYPLPFYGTMRDILSLPLATVKNGILEPFLVSRLLIHQSKRKLIQILQMLFCHPTYFVFMKLGVPNIFGLFVVV